MSLQMASARLCRKTEEQIALCPPPSNRGFKFTHRINSLSFLVKTRNSGLNE